MAKLRSALASAGPPFWAAWRGWGFRALWTFCLVLLLPATAAAQRPTRQVLLIHSFQRDFAPFDTIASEFKTGLSQASDDTIIFFDVTVSLSRSAEASSDTALLDYLTRSFAAERLDLVVALGGPATRFIQRHQQELFPTTPLLLAGVDERNVEYGLLSAKDAVVAVRNDLRRWAENILSLLPQTREIFVVVGSSMFERRWRDRMMTELVVLNGRVKVTYLDDLSFAEMLRRCRTLSPHSAVMFGLLWVDRAGVPMTEEQALPALHASCNAPIFGLHSTQVGRGTVGGSVMAIDRVADNVTEAARRILMGEPPTTVSPPTQLAEAHVFDARELRRWGISEARLPASSTVLFREPTVWQQYRWPIALALAVGLVQASLIGTLLANRVRRQRAERSLLESSRRLATILDTAGEGIVTLKEDGSIESMNAAAEALFGWTVAEVEGRHVHDLMPGIFTAPDGSGHPLLIGLREVTGRRRDGSTVPLEFTVRETALVSRHVFTCVVRDLTDRKLAESHERQFGQRLLHAQEDERARLARELHDDVSQRLAQLALDTSRPGEGSSRRGPAPSSNLHEVHQGLLRLSEDVHTLAYRLHPRFLAHLGLARALRTECERVARQHSLRVHASLESTGDSISKDAALCLFRVAQEALHNVARHSRANAVLVSMTDVADGVELVIQDHGVGFDVSLQNRTPSLGLASMRERVQAAGGWLKIESAPGRGTSITAWLPVEAASCKYASS